MNEDNLTHNKKCNVFSIKAKSIKFDEIDYLIPPMKDDAVKLELWIDYNFSNETITFFCDGKSFKNSDCVWLFFEITADNIQDYEFQTSQLTINLKSPMYTNNKTVANFVQVYKSVCFEFKMDSDSDFNYFYKKIWPAFQQRVSMNQPQSNNDLVLPETTSKENILPLKILVEENCNAIPKDEFKVPSVENIPKKSRKRQYLSKLDLNKVETRSKRINLVKPIQLQHDTTKSKTESTNLLTINLSNATRTSAKRFISKQSTPNDVYDFDFESNDINTIRTPKKRVRQIVKPYNYNSDSVSQVQLSMNGKASFSYRAAADAAKKLSKEKSL